MKKSFLFLLLTRSNRLINSIRVTVVLILLLYCQASCKKNKDGEEPIYFNAVLIDYNTRQPVPNVKILYNRQTAYVHQNIPEPWSMLFADTTTGMNHVPFIYFSKDSAYTDANGRCSFQYTSGIAPEALSLANDSLIIARVSFNLYGHNFSGVDTIFSDKKGYLLMKMQKTTPVFANDTAFQYRKFLGIPPWIYFPGITAFKGQVGIASRTIIDSFPVSIYSRTAIEWRYYRNGLQSSGVDTITLNTTGNRTTLVNVLY